MDSFKFIHPFTCMVSGPTCCGKTQFVTRVLQNCYTKISPPPEKIIWLYKRWQPLYDVIHNSVVPEVEFIQGIPPTIDQDTFIDPSVKNLLILDDLMSTCAKDSRINELFTEGSHHRNLSVMSINQNLFHNRDPTQRRNTHYLVLFNNPVDKQPVMTLSRQIYPENPQHLMKHYKEATLKNYGYLLVDLKPFTEETKRLVTNILANDVMTGKMKVEEKLSVNSDTKHNHTGENQYMKRMYDMAIENNEEKRRSKMKKYQSLRKDEREKKVKEKMKKNYLIEFLNLYGENILNTLKMQDDEIHSKIMQNINNMLSRGFCKRDSVRASLTLYKDQLERRFQYD